MSALLRADLSLDTYCDYTASFTWGAGDAQPTSFVGATAELAIRATPTDPGPIVLVSTTPGVDGSIALGIAPPGPLGATVANVAALEIYNASALVAGTLVAVTTPSSFYAWAPSGSLVVDGVTVVAGAGGQWLLCATIQFTVTKAAMLALVGTAQASYDLVVTWADGTTTKFLDGQVFVEQTVTH